MPEKPPRRRPSTTRRRIRPPNPSPRRRIRRVLTRSASEPIIRLIAKEEEAAEFDDPPLLQFHQRNSFTCVDGFSSSSPSLPGLSSFDGYSRDAKVVVNVTVEGSPGPVRTMVKLGSTVEDTIKLVVNKYSEEGRTPKLNRGSSDHHHHDPSSSYELHHSHFSLRCLEKSELIGDVGSRSFYLRRNSSLSEENAIMPPPPAMFPLQSFFAVKFGKVVRRTRRLWNMLVCLQ
ncbi:Uncharacterized protein At4g22758 [Linum perenne]